MPARAAIRTFPLSSSLLFLSFPPPPTRTRRHTAPRPVPTSVKLAEQLAPMPTRVTFPSLPRYTSHALLPPILRSLRSLSACLAPRRILAPTRAASLVESSWHQLQTPCPTLTDVSECPPIHSLHFSLPQTQTRTPPHTHTHTHTPSRPRKRRQDVGHPHVCPRALPLCGASEEQHRGHPRRGDPREREHDHHRHQPRPGRQADPDVE